MTVLIVLVEKTRDLSLVSECCRLLDFLTTSTILLVPVISKMNPMRVDGGGVKVPSGTLGVRIVSGLSVCPKPRGLF